MSTHMPELDDAGRRRVIHKFLIPIRESPLAAIWVGMPPGAQLLHVHDQPPEGLHVWALVDLDVGYVQRVFRVLPTGMAVSDWAGASYVGTAHLHGGRVVVHVFDHGEAAP